MGLQLFVELFPHSLVFWGKMNDIIDRGQSMPLNPENRCQRTGPFGQCDEAKVEGAEFCEAHGGKRHVDKKQRRMYDLAQSELRGLYGQMADREDILSLRQEVALIRAAIQKFTNLMSQSDQSFESKIGMFHNLLLTSKALVAECVKVERSAGLSVDRAQLLHFAGEVIQICADETDGLPGAQDVLERIASRVVEAVQSAGETSNEAE